MYEMDLVVCSNTSNIRELVTILVLIVCDDDVLVLIVCDDEL